MSAYFSVKPAWPSQRRIQGVRPVCRCHNHHPILTSTSTVQQRQQLSNQAILRSAAGAPSFRAQSIDLINKEHGRALTGHLPALFKDASQILLAFPRPGAVQRGAADAQQIRAHLLRHCLHQERLPHPRRADQQHPVGDGKPQLLKRPRETERQVDHLLQRLSHIVQPRHGNFCRVLR